MGRAVLGGLGQLGWSPSVAIPPTVAGGAAVPGPMPGAALLMTQPKIWPGVSRSQDPRWRGSTGIGPGEDPGPLLWDYFCVAFRQDATAFCRYVIVDPNQGVSAIFDRLDRGISQIVVPRTHQVYCVNLDNRTTNVSVSAYPCPQPLQTLHQVLEVAIAAGPAAVIVNAPAQGAIEAVVAATAVAVTIGAGIAGADTAIALAAGGAPVRLGACVSGEPIILTFAGAGRARVAFQVAVPG